MTQPAHLHLLILGCTAVCRGSRAAECRVIPPCLCYRSVALSHTAAQQAFRATATRILSLSGTRFRTRDPIAFIETTDGKSVADYSYSYCDALADGVCRPLKFVAIGGTATFQTPGGSAETVSFEDDLNDQGESYRLLTVLAPNDDHLREMLRTGEEELTRLRTTSDPDAGGLVV
jgi:hypothetical protein